ncbi:MAG: Hsp20/alpha crystallin family protein [Candidatus Magasanikbacteria bacterium]|nr:Hsp20/alpha crystallin family protein [Candidatus Magasanikbacteria bacterium]
MKRISINNPLKKLGLKQPNTNQGANTMDDWISDWEKLDFLSQHGELAVDVFENANEIVIKSAVAGIKPGDIDISINHDVLTIKGQRHNEDKIERKNYLFQECYWGNFSRTIVLPSQVLSDQVKATLKNGILTVSIPKAAPEKSIKVQALD